MKQILYAFCFTILLTSCQVVLKKMYGIHKPRIENETSIKKCAVKYGMDTNNIVTVNSTDFMQVLSHTGVPDGAVFDSNGNFIEYRTYDTAKCNAGLFGFISALQKNGIYNETGKTKLSTELSKFLNVKGGPASFKDLDQYDYVILLYWCTWAGKLNKDHVQPWEQLAKENKNVRIKVIKVNLDIQEYWPRMEKKNIKAQLRNKKQVV